MRHAYNSLLKKIVVIATFVALQGVSIFLMARNSVIQQAGIVRYINSGHYFVWKHQKNIDNYFHLNAVNKELSEENLRLRSELFTYQSTITPPAPFDSVYSYICAEVIHNTTAHIQNYLIINKGSNHGVEPDMGVVGNYGIIGIVHTVSENNARVLSLLNNKIRISARIEPGNATGSLVWDGKSIHSATISDIPQHSQVAVGDTAVTSGISQIFPASIPLGVVTSTSITQGTFLEAQIRLFQNFNTLRYVYVIRNLHAQEINNLLMEP